MELRLTKKNSVVFAIVIIVLCGSLGYLVWRVNQKETTAPTEGEAAGKHCSTGAQCTADATFEGCYWPYTAYCGNEICTCKTVEWQRDNAPVGYACLDTRPTCTPVPPAGDYVACCTYDKCDDPDCEKGDPGVKVSVCTARCNGCNNPYFYQVRYKKISSCGDGIVGNTEGEECDPPNNPCTKDGKQGVCSNTCKCIVNPYCGDGQLKDDEECEVGDPSGVKCTWTSCNQNACICLPPSLGISKSAVEKCIDEKTENPKSELLYTITVNNTGTGVGQISKIEDTLDTKVVAASIVPSDITEGGSYLNGKITWLFSTPLTISPGETKVYSYKIIVNKENFGTYTNSVILTPVSGDVIQANANITADCIVVVPQTGVFDNTIGRITMGFGLILFGGFVYSLPSSMLMSNISTSERKRYKYRVKFEGKFVKK